MYLILLNAPTETPYLLLGQGTLMVMQWGQFLDHDITLTLVSDPKDDNGQTESCCTESVFATPPPNPWGRRRKRSLEQDPRLHIECFPVTIPDMDPTFASLG